MFVVRNVKFTNEKKRLKKIEELKKNVLSNMKKIWDEIEIQDKPFTYSQVVEIEFIVLPDFTKKTKKQLFQKMTQDLGKRFKLKSSPWCKGINFKERLQLDFFPKRAEKICENLDKNKELNLDDINDLVLTETCKNIEKEVRKSTESFWNEIEREAKKKTPNFKSDVNSFFAFISFELKTKMINYNFKGKNEIISIFSQKFNEKKKYYSQIAAEKMSETFLKKLKSDFKTIKTVSLQSLINQGKAKTSININEYNRIICSNIPFQEKMMENEYKRKALIVKEEFLKKKGKSIICEKFEKKYDDAKEEVIKRVKSIEASDIQFFVGEVLKLKSAAASIFIF